MPYAFFDIVGTCFGYEAGEEAVQQRIGTKLAKYGLSSKMFFHLWLVTCERDSAFMVFTEQAKVPNVERWRMVFWRVLYQCGVPTAEIDNVASDADVEWMVDEYLYNLKPRPGLAEMLKTLADGGVEFYCCSGASVDRVKNYFDRAGIDMPEDRIWDVTPVGVHKPNLTVYKALLAEWQAKHPKEVMIFGASHAWDCAGAKKCGWETAYVTEYELYECTPMWGKHDVVARDLSSLGKAIVERWGRA